MKFKLKEKQQLNKKFLCELYNLHIYLVSGNSIRDLYDVNFCLGGHGYVYDFIPKNEVWIEDSQEDIEVMMTIIHELFEIQQMKLGNTYDSAHEDSIELEKFVRPYLERIKNE